MFEFGEHRKETAWIDESLTECCREEKCVTFPLRALIIESADEITAAEKNN